MFAGHSAIDRRRPCAPISSSSSYVVLGGFGAVIGSCQCSYPVAFSLRHLSHRLRRHYSLTRNAPSSAWVLFSMQLADEKTKRPARVQNRAKSTMVLGLMRKRLSRWVIEEVDGPHSAERRQKCFYHLVRAHQDTVIGRWIKLLAILPFPAVVIRYCSISRSRLREVR